MTRAEQRQAGIERAARFAQMRADGMTNAAIGRHEGICRERVGSILGRLSPRKPRYPEWESEKKQWLQKLWAEGHSISAIGREMHISRNAVVGQAHRMDLPGRPSPIRRVA